MLVRVQSGAQRHTCLKTKYMIDIVNITLIFAFIFTIINRLYTKYVLFKMDSFGLAILTNAVCAVLVFPFLIYFYPSWYSLTQLEFLIILILGILWAYVAWIGNLSIAQNNFSFKEIIRQTRVIWVVLAGIFLLGESISKIDLLGIALVILSVYIISYKHVSFKEHVTPGPVLLAWSVALVAALIVILEKVILASVPVTVYAFYVYILPTLFLLPFCKKENLLNTKKIFLVHKKEAIICSLLMLASYFAALYSYQNFPISISYPIIQSSTVFGVLVGTYLFEDNKDIKKKIFAVIVAIVGVILIKLF